MFLSMWRIHLFLLWSLLRLTIMPLVRRKLCSQTVVELQPTEPLLNGTRQPG